jgi:ABC-type transport system involved in multi-copper enzyme maturation permease subunit
VFDLSLEGMAFGRKSVMLAGLIALPAVAALAYRLSFGGAGQAPPIPPLELYAVLVAVYWIRNVIPLAALFHATALIADEVEERTLTYLLTRPISRASILLGKFAAYLATTLGVTLPAVVLTFFLLATAKGAVGVGAAVGHLFRDLGAAALGLLAYGALFALLGVLLRRPVIPGLLFLFVWEQLANLPGYLPRLTLTAWLRSLVRHRPAEEGLAGLFGQVLPAPWALAVLVTASVVFLALAVLVFSRREYVLEQ